MIQFDLISFKSIGYTSINKNYTKQKLAICTVNIRFIVCFIVYLLIYFFPFSPLTSELQSSELEGDEAIADLDEVNESIEVIRRQDKAVSGAVVSPAAQLQISTQRVLERTRQMLIEDGV